MEIRSRNWPWWAIIGVTIAAAVVLVMSQRLGAKRQAAGASLEFIGCKRWPDTGNFYAEFQLINNTSNTIQYPLIRDAGPKDTVALSREGRWRPVQWDACSKGEVFMLHPLKPGRKVALIVPLDSRAPAKQFAVPCKGLPAVKRSELSKRMRLWLVPVARALHIAITPPAFLADYDQMVWCPELIAAPRPVPPQAGR